MTVLDDRPLVGRRTIRPPDASPGLRVSPVRTPPRTDRPVGSRPAIAPPAYRGGGVGFSRAAHRRGTVSASMTVALAGLTALITLWLGSLAHSRTEQTAAPDRLAVVQVQAGETLHDLAVRVAPGAPADQVIDRIKDLNEMDSAALDAGQTLIAPVS